MLPVLSSSPKYWRQILRNNFFDCNKLADFLELTDEQRQRIVRHPRFALNLPFRLAAKIQKRTLDDPILKQFLPIEEENRDLSAFSEDPVGDNNCRKSSKLLHKYHGRVLIVCSSACAMHCRYCFRQHFDYEVQDKSFDDELKLIEADPSINEVILSGGDPLSLDDRILSSLLRRLAKIAHVRKVRFHTRFPIGIPERIDDSFLEMLREIPLQFWFVVHTNHPRELDDDIFAALRSIQKLGIPVLNQSVLLRGVNDTVDVLAELFGALVNQGVFPYYLHQLDRVKGASHFEVAEEHGKRLIADLSTILPGYAVPQYVKEVPGALGKTLIL